MRLYVELNIILLALLIAGFFATAAEARPCARLSGDHAIRRAVIAGTTIVITSIGTYASCAPRPAAVKVQVVAPPPMIVIRFPPQSAAVPEESVATLGLLMQRVTTTGETVTITALAFSAGDPAHAARLAHARGVALRNMLLELGGAAPRIALQAFGGWSGEDRVEIELHPPPRASPARA